MQVERIRSLVKKRPFRPLELLADGGQNLFIIHPEQVIFGEELIIAVQPDGEPDYIDAEIVRKVRVLRLPPPPP
jgi:hypothetical protein